MTNPTPTSAAAMTALHELVRLKGMDAVIDYHYQMAQSPTPSPARERHEAEHDRLVAIRNAAEPAAWEAARAALAQAASAQVEAVQAQPASETRECCNDECEWRGTTTRMLGTVGPLCPECGEVTEPASAPMGDAKDNAVLQAKTWAQEARTQRGTVLDILRYFGLPEHDWEALRLIREKLESADGISGESSGAARKDGVRPVEVPSSYMARVYDLLGIAKDCRTPDVLMERVLDLHRRATNGVAASAKTVDETRNEGGA